MKKAANIIGIALILLAVLALINPHPPGPGPGPVKGLRVVFVWESSKGFPTTDMANAWNSIDVENWLVANCEGGAEGRRRWDKDVSTTNESVVWQEIWSAAKPQLGQLPQVLVVGSKDPQKGKLYPFPKNTQELLKFLEGVK